MSFAPFVTPRALDNFGNALVFSITCGERVDGGATFRGYEVSAGMGALDATVNNTVPLFATGAAGVALSPVACFSSTTNSTRLTIRQGVGFEDFQAVDVAYIAAQQFFCAFGGSTFLISGASKYEVLGDKISTYAVEYVLDRVSGTQTAFGLLVPGSTLQIALGN